MASWTYPLRGNYSIGASYGQTGPHWETIHTGQDFPAPTGTPVYAVDTGVVRRTSRGGAYGNKIEVRHADGWVSWYAHLNSFSVITGSIVSPHTKIGTVGATGNVTGPHLHLERRDNEGQHYDPMPMFTGEKPPAPDGKPPILLPDTGGLDITSGETWQRVGLFIGGGALIVFVVVRVGVFK